MNQTTMFDTTPEPTQYDNMPVATPPPSDNARYQELIDEVWKRPGRNMVQLVAALGEGWTGEEFWRLVKRAEEAGEVHSVHGWNGFTWFPGTRTEAKK